MKETTMTKRETLKKEIDKLPEHVIEEMYKLAHTTPQKKVKKRIKTLKLNGQYDDLHLRDIAYEQNAS
jgi:hypothetical protein